MKLPLSTIPDEIREAYKIEKLNTTVNEEIETAFQNLFRLIENPSVISSTNIPEGCFSHLKEHCRHHRGLSLRYRSQYFAWYHFLVQY
jgi:hypothetical protein